MAYILTPYRAGDLLKLSEKHDGHPCSKHLTISNDGLMRRLHEGGAGARDHYMAYISSFLTLADAGKAASEVFQKTPKGAVKQVAEGRVQQREFVDITTNSVFRARFATGGGVRVLEGIDRMTLVIRHRPNLEPYNFIVVTFFPRPPEAWRLGPA